MSEKKPQYLNVDFLEANNKFHGFIKVNNLGCGITSTEAFAWHMKNLCLQTEQSFEMTHSC